MCGLCRDRSFHSFAPSRRTAMVVAASAIGLLLGNAAGAKQVKAPPKPQNVLSPDASLERLRAGNERYVEGVSRRHDFKHEREVLVGGKTPMRVF